MKIQIRGIASVLYDSVIVVASIVFSYTILLQQDISSSSSTMIITSSVVHLFCYYFFIRKYNLCNRAWEYSGIGELLSLFKAISYSIAIVAITQVILFQDLFGRTLLSTWMLNILLIGGSRFVWRLYRDNYIKGRSNRTRALIIGAGAAGRMVVRQLKYNNEVQLYPVAFIDDNIKMHRLDILGVPVVGGTEEIDEIVKIHNIERIIVAIPSLKKIELNRILSICSKTGIKTQILPMIEDIIIGKVSINQFRDVQVEDLLGRNPVELDTENIVSYIKNKVVLVTGAGGSIGSEICRQASRFSPTKLILLGHGENSIYDIELELKALFGASLSYTTEIADIQDRDKMFSIMEKYSPSVIFHAAAHKHVPLMERNPEEAVKNNIIGTMNVAEAASHYGVSTFVMVSTDKAVNPQSVMGASKRLAEMIVQNMDRCSSTRFVAVRFGNVLGSRGSVIPLFTEQIRRGGPITVTHPEMVRYFMTIPEASRLVLQAGAIERSGEIFVLHMGEPVKIIDLAKNLIRLSGLTENDIEIVYTGTRPGEKLFEELLNENEVGNQQIYPKIYIGKSVPVDMMKIEGLINTYQTMKPDELRSKLLLIANYKREVTV